MYGGFFYCTGYDINFGESSVLKKAPLIAIKVNLLLRLL